MLRNLRIGCPALCHGGICFLLRHGFLAGLRYMQDNIQMKKTVIEKATTDKPVHFPVDADKPGILVVHHKPTGKTIQTWGWSLRQVLFHMAWKTKDIWAVYKRPWKKTRAAVDMTPGVKPDLFLNKLNPEGGNE